MDLRPIVLQVKTNIRYSEAIKVTLPQLTVNRDDPSEKV